ncbi:tetratricopeptide repeat protein [Stieleria maiorica]|uniref:Tetratricopeptide repeat protein n=1 Tax=Stieleria maiorica TaxID=2795974 RepID=A0A5B9MG95_9BACT|nr:FG-GAP-like repeat-containing protein [Stieleria maiorica]QEF98604.1 tetratricopeptide repeat protein [Stieleria maiorica]
MNHSPSSHPIWPIGRFWIDRTAILHRQLLTVKKALRVAPHSGVRLLLLLLSLSPCLSGCDQPDEAPERGETSQTTQRVSSDQTGGGDPTSTDFVARSFDALSAGDLDGAEAAIRKHLLQDPEDARAIELAGDIASQQGNTETAIEMYQGALASTDSPNEALLDKLTHTLVAAGRPFDAITVLQTFVDRFPNRPQPRFDLIGLATMVGRTPLALPSLQWLAQHGQGDPESLLVLADPDRVEPDGEMCQSMLQRSGDDLRPQYSLARLDALKSNWRSVADRLKPVLRRQRDFAPAHALYGRALVELDEFESIPDWQRQLPGSVDQLPEYWLVAGDWAQRQGQHEQAARAYWQAIRQSSHALPAALNGLFQSLTLIGRTGDADKVADQITKLGVLRDTLKTHLERGGRSQRAALEVADAMLELGRVWEAEGWARFATTLPEEPVADIRDRYMAVRSKLTTGTPWVLPEMEVSRQIDVANLPSISWKLSRSPSEAMGDSFQRPLYFENQAQRRGFVHTCEIAPEAVTEGHWIYQSVGGGVGVIDYDLDGWPDLAAAMLNGRPLQSDSSSNRLFRNHGETFVATERPAAYHDTGFSQGITIGDYNDDGFPDIFDCNYGQNRLFRNNGDGTFDEISMPAGLSDQSWTTSAVIADLDGDGIADLFATNYCAGRAPLDRPCRNADGFSTCPPLLFEAEPDRVWRGRGDGTFVDVSARWLKDQAPGRGLGLVTGQFDERPGLDVYVANDMTANQLWSPEVREGQFRLVDLAATRGVGFSGDARSQASMGIAAADPDADGDIDFFLTHFADDHNTYYEQVSPGFWTDRSFQVGLGQPSMKLLGFGAEWVDFDNSGSLELMVTNGHVDDVKRTDVAYAMPPQTFRRQRSGRWEELPPDSMGDYFSKPHLGRALSSVDVDRDGRTDVVITHLYEPVSLLVNRTDDAGQSVGLILKATRSQRDAIGAVATATVESQTVTHQLTAGDGYMCTNQRRISIGLGDQSAAQAVTIKWPSGATQSFGTLQGGRDYVLVEGEQEAFQLQGHR